VVITICMWSSCNRKERLPDSGNEHYYRGLQKNEELLRLLLPATEEHSCLLNKRNKDKLLRFKKMCGGMQLKWKQLGNMIYS
jgi:hypothetical protein